MDTVLDLAPVIPVVVLEDARDAVPLARALVAGGLRAIEVTLRTPAALDSIAAIAHEVPDAVVGAGTLRDPDQVAAAEAAGARFLVSPGWTERLVDAMRGSGLPYLPGVSTVSEVLRLLERGVTDMKFFPAEAAGGAPYLKSLWSPLPQAVSARPAASTPTAHRTTSRCPTSPVSAARGCCRRKRCGRRRGTRSPSWPVRPRHSPAEAPTGEAARVKAQPVHPASRPRRCAVALTYRTEVLPSA